MGELLQIARELSEDEEKVTLDVLYRKFKAICWVCHKFVPRDKASRDHVVPKSVGGSDDLSNLALAHKKCNNDRGNGYVQIHSSEYNIAELDKELHILREHGLYYQVWFDKHGTLRVLLAKAKENWT